MERAFTHFSNDLEMLRRSVIACGAERAETRPRSTPRPPTPTPTLSECWNRCGAGSSDVHLMTSKHHKRGYMLKRMEKKAVNQSRMYGKQTVRDAARQWQVRGLPCCESPVTSPESTRFTEVRVPRTTSMTEASCRGMKRLRVEHSFQGIVAHAVSSSISKRRRLSMNKHPMVARQGLRLLP